jgi:hypothetical protein
MSAISSILRDTTDNGLMFWCPGCDGAHVINYGEGSGPRWIWNGDVNKPTFQPSVLVRYDHLVPHYVPGQPEVPQTKVTDICHSFVTDGHIQFLSDCTHALAGQTVDLPDWSSP